MALRAFNLFDTAWIPVRWLPYAAGPRSPKVGFRELLERSQDIEALDIALPPAHSALLRILYALTARVTRLDENRDDTWDDRRLAIFNEGRLPRLERDADGGEYGIKKYVQEQYDHFYLFDEHDGEELGRPWMQDPRLREECKAQKASDEPPEKTGLNKLITYRVAGNSHAWFTHTNDDVVDSADPAEAVLHMLMWLYYGPAGQVTARRPGGKSLASATAAVLRGSLSFHPEGASLFVTLLTGLARPDRAVSRTTDLCPWESAHLRNPALRGSVAKDPCSQLTAPNRHAALLVPDAEGQRVTGAWTTLGCTQADPGDDGYVVWLWKKTTEKEREDAEKRGDRVEEWKRITHKADPKRALWRDLDGLFAERRPQEDRLPEPPRIIEQAAELTEDFRIRALGFAQDGNSRDLQFVSALTPSVVGHANNRHPAVRNAVRDLRKLGERYGENLKKAVKKAWKEYTSASGSADKVQHTDRLVAAAEARYWPAAEREFWSRFETLRDIDSSKGLDIRAARASFRRLAEQAYEVATEPISHTPRGAEAVSAARGLLLSGK